MAVSLKHSKTSTKADGTNTDLVQPSDWNAEHVLSQGTGKLLGRTSAGTGPTEEISVGSGLTLSAGSISADFTGYLTASTAASTYVAKAGDTMTGNLSFSGSARRITGDTANATIANRLLFQDSTTDSLSAFGIIPNGTADSTYVQLFNSSTPDNSSFLNLFAGPTRTSITSAKIGTGSYLPLIFATGGADRVAIDTSGNVGIGTNTPNAGTKLHVAGGELLIEGTSGNLSTLRYSYNGTNRATTYWSESVTRLITALNGAGDFQWSSNNTQRMILDSSGNLGINQSSPAAKLDISGGIATNVVAVAASAIDCSAGTVFTKTASGALTWTFTNVPASRAFTVILELTNGGTGAQSWPAAVKWPGGTAPTLMTSGVDVLGFITDDGGTTWRGSLLMKDSR